MYKVNINNVLYVLSYCIFIRRTGIVYQVYLPNKILRAFFLINYNVDENNGVFQLTTIFP